MFFQAVKVTGFRYVLITVLYVSICLNELETTKIRAGGIFDALTPAVGASFDTLDKLMGSFKKALEHPNLSENCKTTIELCISTPEAENCKKDALECLKETVVGSTATVIYSDLGKDLNLEVILEDISKELSLTDATGVAKKLLSQCIGADTSVVREALDFLQSKTQTEPKLTPQHEFLCSALTGRDVGTFPDSSSAPKECDYAGAKTICEQTIVRPSIGTLFGDWYPTITSATESQTPSLPNCWAHKDRAQCVAAIILGKVCASKCQLATCIFTQLSSSYVDCATKIKNEQEKFFAGAIHQCQLVAKALASEKEVKPCPGTGTSSMKQTSDATSLRALYYRCANYLSLAIMLYVTASTTFIPSLF